MSDIVTALLVGVFIIFVLLILVLAVMVIRLIYRIKQVNEAVDDTAQVFAHNAATLKRTVSSVILVKSLIAKVQKKSK